MKSKTDKLNEFLKIIADPNRLKILVFLEKSPKCVCKIFPMLKISQKLASHHLSQLKKLDLVKQKRNGNFMHYSINKKVLKKYMQIFNSTIKP